MSSIRGERVALRPLTRADAPHLAKLAAAPEVSRWWPGLDEQLLVEIVEGREDVEGFAIEYDRRVVGFAQTWEDTDPEYRHAGIDLFLEESLQGRGLGRDVVRALARWLVEECGHHRITIDPALANERAVRCYEAAGFKRVGVLRRYWRGPDGEWHDGLLLDLLAEEL